MKDFLINNCDELIVGIILIILGAIMAATWKTIVRIIKFIYKKIIGFIIKFKNKIIRIKDRQLTPEEEFLIVLYRNQEGIVDEVVIDEEWEDNPEVQKYLKRAEMRAGTKRKTAEDNLPKPDKIRKPSKWKMKVYEELVQKRNEQKRQRIKERKDQRDRLEEMYPDGIPIPNMAKGILPESFYIQFAKEEQKQKDRKTQENILKELKKLNKKKK